MNKEYKFYKCENNAQGSDYCFCQRPVDSNMSLSCFLENGEILGFMSETLVCEHPEIKEIDMNEFMFYFVRPLIRKNKNYKDQLQQKDKAIEFIKKYKDEWHEYDEVQKDMNQLLKILGGNYE